MKPNEHIETIAACHGCTATARPGPRLPRGWKRLTETTVLCPACLASRYLHRAITLPVAGPLDATWAALGAALKVAWVETTRCANWIVTTLYARDVRRQPGEIRLAPMPRVYLYPEARAQFPALSPIHLTALLRQVERTYRQQRYELLWTGARSLAVHRYPVPMPIHTQGIQLEPEADGNGALVVRVRIGEGWWRLRLRRGREFGVHVARVQQLLAGTALIGSGAIYAITAHDGDHRSGVPQRRVMLKITGYFPRPVRDAEGMLAVETGASSLIVARQHGHGVVLTIHGDQIRRGIAGYEVRRARLATDLGVQRRFRAGAIAGMRQRQTDMATRQRCWLKTQCQQLAAAIAGCAARRGLAGVSYADDEEGFCTPFPWQALRLDVQHAVEGRGLVWHYVSGDPATESRTPLAETVGVE